MSENASKLQIHVMMLKNPGNIIPINKWKGLDHYGLCKFEPNRQTLHLVNIFPWIIKFYDRILLIFSHRVFTILTVPCNNEKQNLM